MDIKTICGFSFHTFQLNHNLTYEQYREIKDNIYNIAKKAKSKVILENGCITSLHYKSNGVRIKLYENKETRPHIEVIVNPRLLMGIYDYVGIFKCTNENVDIVVTNLNIILREISSMVYLQDFNISRMDLCVNISFDDSLLLDEYMRLINRGYIPKTYERIVFPRNEKNSKEKNKNSFRVTNTYRTVTIYNKTFQLKQEGLSDIKEHIMRIELSLNRCSIHEHEQKIKNTDLKSKLLYWGDNSESLIKTTLEDVITMGVHVKYNDIIRIISNSNYKNKTKKKMEKFIVISSQCHDLNNAMSSMKKQIKDFCDDDEYKLMNKFKKIGVNPSTMKNRSINIMVPSIADVLYNIE